MSKGSWSSSTRGFWRRQLVFVFAVVVLVLLLLGLELGTSPLGLIIIFVSGGAAGPAIHGVIYRRLRQADHHYRRGVEAYEAERPDEAIAELTKALDLSGGEGKAMKWDAHAYAYRAGAYAVLEDIGRAVSDLEKAQSLTRDPDVKAHVEGQLQELREEIGHGGSQGVTRREASVSSRTGG